MTPPVRLRTRQVTGFPRLETGEERECSGAARRGYFCGGAVPWSKIELTPETTF